MHKEVKGNYMLLNFNKIRNKRFLIL